MVPKSLAPVRAPTPRSLRIPHHALVCRRELRSHCGLLGGSWVWGLQT